MEGRFLAVELDFVDEPGDVSEAVGLLLNRSDLVVDALSAGGALAFQPVALVGELWTVGPREPAPGAGGVWPGGRGALDHGCAGESRLFVVFPLRAEEDLRNILANIRKPSDFSTGSTS